MIKRIKLYKITYNIGNKIYSEVGTLEELINVFGYILECGAYYSYEKGNKKINCNPKGIKSLVSNLNKAVHNSIADGYPNKSFSIRELTEEDIKDYKIYS